MPRVVYSPRAVAHLERSFAFVAERAREAAVASARAIRGAVEMLARHPFIGRAVRGEIRELVISYGQSGYLALYRFFPAKDEVRVLAIRRQRELDYPL